MGGIATALQGFSSQHSLLGTDRQHVLGTGPQATVLRWVLCTWWHASPASGGPERAEHCLECAPPPHARDVQLVFRCQHTSTGEEFALKVYRKGASAHRAQSVEVKTLQVADQDGVPNVPKVVAHGAQIGYPWVVQT